MWSTIKRRRPTPAGVIATIALGVALGGVATAAIPDAQGVVTMCLDRAGGVRVVDTARDACKLNERTVAVNQKGIQGEVGPQGPAGPRGETGPRGPQGETGATGPQGAKGETGPRGEIGPRGETGPAGAVGPVGPMGPRGPQGLTGPAGPPDPVVAAFVDRFGNGGNVPEANFGSRDCALGEIVLTAAIALPKNFTPARGQTLPIDNNEALFSALDGFRYGGNGTTNFKLPDLRALEPDGMTYGVCTAGVFPVPPGS